MENKAVLMSELALLSKKVKDVEAQLDTILDK